MAPPTTLSRGPAHRPYQIACRWAVSGRCYFLQLPAAGRPGKGQWGGETETGEKHSTWSGGPEERRLATPPGAPIVPPPTSSSEAQLQPPAISFHQGRGTQTGLRKGLRLEWWACGHEAGTCSAGPHAVATPHSACRSPECCSHSHPPPKTDRMGQLRKVRVRRQGAPLGRAVGVQTCPGAGRLGSRPGAAVHSG